MEKNNFGQSRLLHQLAGNCIKLTKCRRSSGGLFEFYTSLYGSGNLSHLSVQEQVAIAKQRFPPKKKRLARWNLVISHGMRRQVNQLCYRAASFGKEVLEVKLSEEAVDQIYVGCPLIGNMTISKIVHGAFYEVLGWDDKAVRLNDTELEQELLVSMAHMKHLRLGFAMTYASSQSRTLRDTVRLWDTNHHYFSNKHLALGIGRCVHPKLLDIA